MDAFLKKTGAIAALVSLVYSLFAPSIGVYALNNTQLEAANRLASYGIIVDNSGNPGAYRLNSNITRREMLKVMINISGIQVEDKCEGKFVDLPKTDWGCKYAEAALKAGFIAANKRFRPNDNVTDAEALKMIMQAKGLAKKEGVSPWWEAYRQAAVEYGMISRDVKITNKPAKRGDIFVHADSAIQVAEGKKTKEDTFAGKERETGKKTTDTSKDSEDMEDRDTGTGDVTLDDDVNNILKDLFTGDVTGTFTGGVNEASTGGMNQTPSGENQIPGNLDSLTGGLTTPDSFTGSMITPDGLSSTGMVSTGTVTGGTELTVSLNPSSPQNGTQIPKSGTVRVAIVDFTAGASDVSLNEVEIRSTALASVPANTRIWFEKNGTRLTGKAAFSSDRVATVSFTPSYVVKAGKTESLDLYIEINTDAGNDFRFTGKVTSSSASSNRGEFVTPIVSTANYVVAPVSFRKLGSTTTYNQSDEFVELGRFSISNDDTSSETRDVKFQSIVLRNNGNADLADLKDIYLERNGEKVSKDARVSGKDVTFTLEDIIRDGTTATYYIKAKVANVQNNNGDTYEFSLRNDSDLNVVEVLNGFRSTVTRVDTTLATYTVTGSDVKFERDEAVELSRNYARGTNDVTLMKGRIITKTPITLEDPVVGITASDSIHKFFDVIYLQVGSARFSWTTSSGATQARFSGVASVNGTAEVRMYGKLRDNAPQGSVKFDDLRLNSFTKAEYSSNQNIVNSSVGSIAGVTVTVDTTGLSVTRVDGIGNSNLAEGSKGIVIYELSFVVTQGNEVTISNPEYTITASGSYTGNMFVTLFVDNVSRSTKTVTSNRVKFDNVSVRVGRTPVKFTLKVDLSDAYQVGSEFSVRLTDIDATDVLTSQTVSLGNVPSSATFRIAQANGVLSSSDDNPKRSLLVAGDRNQRILAFRVKAENDNVKLRNLVFVGTGIANVSNFRLLASNNEEIAATSVSGNTIKFENILPQDTINSDQYKVYYLIGDINTNVTNVDLEVKLLASGSSIRASNGRVIAIQGSDVSSNVHKIAEQKAVFAKKNNPNKDINTSALRFSVTASGRDRVTLQKITFDNVISGYTGNGKIVVYRETVSNQNKVGELNGTTGEVTLTTNNTVDTGREVEFIVTIEGVIPSSSSNTQSWTVRIDNVQVSGIQARDYYNMGDFPMTETR